MCEQEKVPHTSDEEVEACDEAGATGLLGGAAGGEHSDASFVPSDAEASDSVGATGASAAEGSEDEEAAMEPTSDADDIDKENVDIYYRLRALELAIRNRIGCLRLEEFSLRELRDVLRCTDFINRSHEATAYPLLVRAVARVLESPDGETKVICASEAFSAGVHVQSYFASALESIDWAGISIKCLRERVALKIKMDPNVCAAGQSAAVLQYLADIFTEEQNGASALIFDLLRTLCSPLQS